MESNYDGMIKGFTQLSKTHYEVSNILNNNMVDKVTFGFYSSEGDKANGEMSVIWKHLAEKIVPELIIFSDAWSALSNFKDLIDLLGEHDSENPTPEEFCKYLLECGFKDMTRTVSID